ncbi:MAG: Flp family type IVb pilin [Eubacteriales bacterium]
MKEMMKRFIKEEDGQGMVEYGLIIAGIALVVIVAIFALGPKIGELFNDANSALEDVPTIVAP